MWVWRRRRQIQAIPLDDHALNRTEIQIGRAHEAHARVHAHGGFHEVHRVQAECSSAGVARPPHAFRHERGPDTLPTRGWRHGEQPHLGALSAGGGATVRIRIGRKEEDAAEDGALPLGHDRLGRSVPVKRLEHRAPVGHPERLGHDRGVLLIRSQGDIPNRVAIAVARVSDADRCHGETTLRVLHQACLPNRCLCSCRHL